MFGGRLGGEEEEEGHSIDGKHLFHCRLLSALSAIGGKLTAVQRNLIIHIMTLLL